MTTIEVTKCTLKKEGKTDDGRDWKIYEVETAEGKTLDSFVNLPNGTHEGVIEKNANPAYNDRFKIPKQNGGGAKKFTKNYDFEKKRVALECAVALVGSGHVKMDNLIECRKKFFEYLNS